MILKILLLIYSIYNPTFSISYINETDWLSHRRRLTNTTKECYYLNLFC